MFIQTQSATFNILFLKYMYHFIAKILSRGPFLVQSQNTTPYHTEQTGPSRNGNIVKYGLQQCPYFMIVRETPPCMAAHTYALDVDGINHGDCIVFVTFYCEICISNSRTRQDQLLRSVKRNQFRNRRRGDTPVDDFH